MQEAFGRSLRSYRAARSLSQEALGDILGLHRTYIGALERGDKNLSFRTAERIAERLGVPTLTLLQGPAPTEEIPPERAGEPNTSKRGENLGT